MEIICYVEPLDETPNAIRWNADRSQYMTSDFRWHSLDDGNPFIIPSPVRMYGDTNLRHCAVCGSVLIPTGKQGRPSTKCEGCK